LQKFDLFTIIKLMKSNRSLKQFIYGAGFLIFLALIFTLIYFVWLKPAPTCFDNIQNQNETGVDCGGVCQACELKNLVPLSSNWLKYFPAGKQTAIVAKVNNTNIRWGADSFTYNLDIYGNDKKIIKTLTGNSFIYSGEIKYIFELAEVDSKNVSDIEISFSASDWVKDTDFTRPTTQVRGIKTETSQNGILVSGFITNSNPYNLSKIRIIGFLENPSAIQISASRTELENISAFNETQFKISFPKNINLISVQTATSSKTSSPISNFSQADPDKTEVYVEALR